MQQLEYKKLFSPIIQNCFDDQGKYFIDQFGNILLKNDINLSFSLPISSNLLTFLGEQDLMISTRDLYRIATKKYRIETKEDKVKEQFLFVNQQDETKYQFKLLISFCGHDDDVFFLVNIK